MAVAAATWKEAKDIAAKQALELVYHDFDTKQYGACAKDDLPGHFKAGAWVLHRIFSIRAVSTMEEIEAKEKEFLAAHADWVQGEPVKKESAKAKQSSPEKGTK